VPCNVAVLLLWVDYQQVVCTLPTQSVTMSHPHSFVSCSPCPPVLPGWRHCRRLATCLSNLQPADRVHLLPPPPHPPKSHTHTHIRAPLPSNTSTGWPSPSRRAAPPLPPSSHQVTHYQQGHCREKATNLFPQTPSIPALNSILPLPPPWPPFPSLCQAGGKNLRQTYSQPGCR